MTTPLALITQSLKDYRKEALMLIGYSIWLLLPFAAFILLSFFPPTIFAKIILFALTMVQLFFLVWITIILLLYSQALIQGDPKDMGIFSARAKRLIAPVLWVVLLQMLILLGGFFLLVIPMFIFAVWFGLAQMHVIFDNKRGLEALGMSRDFVRGRFWLCASYLILGPLIILLIYSVFLSVLIALLSAIQGVNPIDTLSGTPPLWMEVLESIGEVLLLPLMTIYATRVYLELKRSKSETATPV